MTTRRPPKVSRLAQRFQAAIDRDVAAKRIAEEQAREERQRLEQAREELLDTLQAFGDGVSWFTCVRGEGSLELRYGERSLRLLAVGSRGELTVEGDGLEGKHRVFLQETMDRWVWSREDRYGREHRELLLDAGLERLISAVFEIAPLAEEEIHTSTEAEAGTGDEPVPFPDKTL